MGSPIPHGYPDWGRQTAPSDVVLKTIAATNIPAATVIFAGYVGNSLFVNVSYSGAANISLVQFSFYEDAAFTKFITSCEYVMDAQHFLRLAVPVGGPYLQVLVSATAFPINPTVGLTIGTSRQTFHNANNNSPPVLINSINAAVGAGVTINATTLSVLPGMACWSVDTALATWTARIQALTFAGAYRTILSMRNTSLPGPRLVFLPPASCRIEFTNTTGAGGNADLFLVSHSGGNF